MRMFDYRCLKCSGWTEALIDTEKIPERIYCECGGVAERRWTKAPGVVGDGEYFSEQLGKTFSSRKQFFNYCKSKGYEVLGSGEWKHTEKDGASTYEEEKKRDTEIENALQESWERVIIGRQSVEPQPVIDMSEDGANA